MNDFFIKKKKTKTIEKRKGVLRTQKKSIKNKKEKYEEKARSQGLDSQVTSMQVPIIK